MLKSLLGKKYICKKRLNMKDNKSFADVVVKKTLHRMGSPLKQSKSKSDVLEPVHRHTEKSCMASYKREFSTIIKIIKITYL